MTYVLGTHSAELQRLGRQHNFWRQECLSGLQRAGFAGGVEADNTADAPEIELKAELGVPDTDYDECLSCQ